MMVNQKTLLTTMIGETGLAFSTNAGSADLHGLGDLGFLCSLGGGLDTETCLSLMSCHTSCYTT